MIKTRTSKLPTRFGQFNIRIYKLEGKEHIAIFTSVLNEPPIVRIHSECITGEVFGSLRCDCGQQLEYALRRISEENNGILIYLRQEGRGIGLFYKIEAYHLQDLGMDTVEANHQLGFEADERTYEIASVILKDMGIRKVRLMTNNPDKIEALMESGIEVVERLPIVIPPNVHNLKYLRTKKEKMGHLIEM